MRSTRALIATSVTALALAGCASTASSPAGPVPDPAASASLASQAAAERSAQAAVSSAEASAASQPCTTHACIVQDLDKGLVGAIDQADAVATKIRCKASTVKNEGGGNYDARCTVHYSDHTYATGYGTVDMSESKVLFSPDE